jgi:phosphatidylserine/phosphatidylglycerophosphate/cardiolipin synthase-like enzyme
MKRDLFPVIFAVLITPTIAFSDTDSSRRQAAVTFYSAPEMNLGEVDRHILDQVGQGGSIHMARFILSDSIMESLRNAAGRGAKVRIYFDPRELERLDLDAEHPFVKLARTRRVEIKIKNRSEGLMHVKAYSVNGSLLRTGSANEPMSDLERQDNDLILVTDREAVAAFDRKFERMWARTSNANFSFA